MKNCSFCGREEPVVVFIGTRNAHAVTCVRCQAQGPTSTSKEVAIELWNGAAVGGTNITPLVEALERLYDVTDALETVQLRTDRQVLGRLIHKIKGFI